MGRVDDLMKKAYELGYSYEAEWGDCSQATIRSLMEMYQNTDKEVFKALSGFHGGGGCEGDGSCGAYAASIYYLSMLFGRELEELGKDPDDPEAGAVLGRLNELVKEVHDNFIEEYGSVICSQIHRKLYGRPFYLNDEDEVKKIMDRGAHDWGCTSVVGNAAKWTVAVIENADNKG
jgi:C_GCAxxG_C_C family probable redox protein